MEKRKENSSLFTQKKFLCGFLKKGDYKNAITKKGKQDRNEILLSCLSRLQSFDFFFGKSSDISYVTDRHPFLLQIPGNVCTTFGTAFFPAFRYSLIHGRSHCAVIVPVFLLAFVVPTALSLVILGYLSLLEQLLVLSDSEGKAK